MILLPSVLLAMLTITALLRSSHKPTFLCIVFFLFRSCFQKVQIQPGDLCLVTSSGEYLESFPLSNRFACPLEMVRSQIDRSTAGKCHACLHLRARAGRNAG